MNTNAGFAVRIVPLASAYVDQIEHIARALPAWSIEEGLQDLRSSAERGPGLVAVDTNDAVTGFVTLDEPFPETWEITWMAVAPARHRCGIGHALIEAMVTNAPAAGTRLLHVKTLAGSHPSPEFARTRAFYQAMGFQRLVVVPELWDPANPCLPMVRAVDS